MKPITPTTTAFQSTLLSTAPHDAVTFATHLEATVTKARDRILEAQDRMERIANKHRQLLTFAVGDKVMLSTENILDDLNAYRQGRKQLPLWIGPFNVLATRDGDVYTLQLPSSFNRVHPTFHVSYLKRYVSNPPEFSTRTPPPPAPVLTADNEEVYLVSDVLDYRITRGQEFYLVVWEGYDSTQSTWIPSVDLGKPWIAYWQKKHPPTQPSSSRQTKRRGRK